MSSEAERTSSRRRFLQYALYGAGGLCVGSVTVLGNPEDVPQVPSIEDLHAFEWGFLVDTTRCIGCGSCVRACKLENHVPETYFRTWVERYEIDEDETITVDSPDGALESFKANSVQTKKVVKAFFVPKLCNHCVNSACTQVCPVGASYHTPDGVVLVDQDHCVGCGYCVQACPYGSRYIDHEKGVADKCTLCYHRIHKGLSPACVDACPREARLHGNLKDPKSRIRAVLHERRYSLLKPDMGTNPKCYYIGLDMEVK
ncbi:MAG: 4Fe-4S dicluster domain-containing protein [Candidatus Omnitrophica bacterium]|nr:Tetrathionate reductase subunit B [bacterium]NUN98812.1 4Fe-4S dicluster domain-containing protein [Candidatus Omnitrophota bacterium]